MHWRETKKNPEIVLEFLNNNHKINKLEIDINLINIKNEKIKLKI